MEEIKDPVDVNVWDSGNKKFYFVKVDANAAITVLVVVMTALTSILTTKNMTMPRF